MTESELAMIIAEQAYTIEKQAEHIKKLSSELAQLIRIKEENEGEI